MGRLFGGEYRHERNLFGTTGSCSSASTPTIATITLEPSVSQYLNRRATGCSTYGRASGSNGWWEYVWARNALDKDYFEQLLAAPAGNGTWALRGGPRRREDLWRTVRYSFD